MSDIKHRKEETKGAFYIEENGSEIASVTYTRNGDVRIIIDHTEVAESHKGSGLGKELVYAAADYARQEGLKVLPLCPFARVVFRRNPQDFSDLS